METNISVVIPSTPWSAGKSTDNIATWVLIPMLCCPFKAERLVVNPDTVTTSWLYKSVPIPTKLPLTRSPSLVKTTLLWILELWVIVEIFFPVKEETFTESPPPSVPVSSKTSLSPIL